MILLGVLFIAIWMAVPHPEGISQAAWRTAGVGLLMAAWWVSEAMPLQVTGLVPLVALPLFEITSIRDAAAPYAHPLIFLFLGGFMLAAALERWNLHRHIALGIVGLVGARPTNIVLGFMLATAFLSMWISNTATAVMMLPIALSVVALVHEGSVGEMPPQENLNFGTALLLGIAYAASIGGAATLIGTPPNALMAAFLAREHGVAIGFGPWMMVGLPLSILLLAAAWLLLTRALYPVGQGRVEGIERVIDNARSRMGPLTATEWRVLGVFATVALLWITRPLLQRALPWLEISDPAIAIAGAIALFIIPAAAPTESGGRRALLAWDEAKKVPWGVLLLLGGGLSLSGAISESGLAAWIGAQLGLAEAWPVWLLVILVAGVVVLLTELTSNTATAAVFVPLAAGFAVTAGLPPVLMAAPVALAASCAFMMPVATPPNAIIFASGHITIGQMVRAGVVMNVLSVAAVSAVALLLVPLIFD